MAALRCTDRLLSPLDLNLFVGQLTSEQKSNPCMLHALNVQRALSMGNYHLFFSLYNTVPNMGGYIMDHFVERERIRALLVMTKSYVPPPLTWCFLSDLNVSVHAGTYRYPCFSSSKNSHSRTSQRRLASFLPTIVPSTPTPITPIPKKCLIASLPLLPSLSRWKKSFGKFRSKGPYDLQHLPPFSQLSHADPPLPLKAHILGSCSGLSGFCHS